MANIKSRFHFSRSCVFESLQRGGLCNFQQPMRGGEAGGGVVVVFYSKE